MKVATVFSLRSVLRGLRRIGMRQAPKRDVHAVALRQSQRELAQMKAGLAHEIAERKRVEQELRQAEAR